MGDRVETVHVGVPRREGRIEDDQGARSRSDQDGAFGVHRQGSHRRQADHAAKRLEGALLQQPHASGAGVTRVIGSGSDRHDPVAVRDRADPTDRPVAAPDVARSRDRDMPVTVAAQFMDGPVHVAHEDPIIRVHRRAGQRRQADHLRRGRQPCLQGVPAADLHATGNVPPFLRLQPMGHDHDPIAVGQRTAPVRDEVLVMPGERLLDGRKVGVQTVDRHGAVEVCEPPAGGEHEDLAEPVDRPAGRAAPGRAVVGRVRASVHHVGLAEPREGVQVDQVHRRAPAMLRPVVLEGNDREIAVGQRQQGCDGGPVPRPERGSRLERFAVEPDQVAGIARARDQNDVTPERRHRQDGHHHGNRNSSSSDVHCSNSHGAVVDARRQRQDWRHASSGDDTEPPWPSYHRATAVASADGSSAGVSRPSPWTTTGPMN